MIEGSEPFAVKRFIWVDVLRGIAALVIVVHHYHHFYLLDASSRSNLPSVETFPFEYVLAPLYGPFAAHAVELFWVISGFVFIHVYLHRPVSAWSFAVARFARLYPMHFATLLYVAALQLISMNVLGYWQVYGNNDARHFVLQLFMSSDWITWSRGLSFNGPIWSVSMELMVYSIFFLCLPLLRLAPFGVSLGLCIVATSWVALEPFQLPLLRHLVLNCAGYFFLGAALYALRPHSGIYRAIFFAAFGLSIAIFGFAVDLDPMLISGVSIMLVSVAAGLDRTTSHFARRLSVLGDISYSVYLVHVPLQMTALMLADLAFGGTRAFASSHLTLPIYFFSTIAVAFWLHMRFERPFGKVIKAGLMKHRERRG